MKIGSKTDQGKVREQNEDCYGYRGNLFVVADGMGGHQAGEVASALAVETILSAALEPDPAAALKEAVSRANRVILDETARRPECEGMGTTVAVLALDGCQAYFTHVGDSRIYLWSRGELTQLTDDHSLVAELVKNGGLSAEEAQNHPQRNILTRALGTQGLAEVEVRSVPARAGEKFLLCSDGLSGGLKENTILQLLSQDAPPQQIAADLVQAANDSGGADNITVIVIEI